MKLTRLHRLITHLARKYRRSLCLAASVVAVWWLIVGLPTHRCTHPQSLGLVVKPTCINQWAIRSLLRHQRPRTIYLIVPDTDACQEYLGSISPLVKCVHEDTLLQQPSVTKASVAAALEANYPQLRVDEYLRGRTPSGWYLQQLLKLGAMQGLPGLSELYVIWDMDMIPTRHIPLTYFPSPHGGAGEAGSGQGGALPAGATIKRLRARPVRTVVNIGGLWNRGYGESYEMLFQRKPTFAEDGTSFVTHWIVVQKALMQQFLDTLCPGPGEQASTGCDWPGNVLKHLPEDDLNTGFSEFHSYVSFVKQHWPETQYELPRKTWMRNPVGDRGPFARQDVLCCPTWWQHNRQWWEGFEYYGLEAGHAEACRWTDLQFERYYGPGT